jgi:Anthrone oxygenase
LQRKCPLLTQSGHERANLLAIGTFHLSLRLSAKRCSRMVLTLQVVTIMVVSVAMALSLAHALELPGKLRLPKEQYLAIQQIYYPGFTYGGSAEPLGLLLLLILLILMPVGGPQFWLTAAAFLVFLSMHAIYWLVTHPVNNFWLKDFQPEKLAGGFFSFDPLHSIDRLRAADWRALRDRWEYSHAIRAALALVSLVLLVTAVAV